MAIKAVVNIFPKPIREAVTYPLIRLGALPPRFKVSQPVPLVTSWPFSASLVQPPSIPFAAKQAAKGKDRGEHTEDSFVHAFIRITLAAGAALAILSYLPATATYFGIAAGVGLLLSSRITLLTSGILLVKAGVAALHTATAAAAIASSVGLIVLGACCWYLYDIGFYKLPLLNKMQFLDALVVCPIAHPIADRLPTNYSIKGAADEPTTTRPNPEPPAQRQEGKSRTADTSTTTRPNPEPAAQHDVLKSGVADSLQRLKKIQESL